MSLFTKLAAEIWRNYVTDGVPSSGANKVNKADVRAYLTEMEAAVDTAQQAAIAAVSVDINRLELARRAALFTTAI